MFLNTKTCPSTTTEIRKMSNFIYFSQNVCPQAYVSEVNATTPLAELHYTSSSAFIPDAAGWQKSISPESDSSPLSYK